jgi:hypothetical protein
MAHEEQFVADLFSTASPEQWKAFRRNQSDLIRKVPAIDSGLVWSIEATAPRPQDLLGSGVKKQDFPLHISHHHSHGEGLEDRLQGLRLAFEQFRFELGPG